MRQLSFFLRTGGVRNPNRFDDMEKYHITNICFAGNLLNVTKKLFLLLADSYKYYLRYFSLTGLSILLSASEYLLNFGLYLTFLPHCTIRSAHCHPNCNFFAYLGVINSYL